MNRCRESLIQPNRPPGGSEMIKFFDSGYGYIKQLLIPVQEIVFLFFYSVFSALKSLNTSAGILLTQLVLKMA